MERASKTGGKKKSARQGEATMLAARTRNATELQGLRQRDSGATARELTTAHADPSPDSFHFVSSSSFSTRRQFPILSVGVGPLRFGSYR